MVLPYSLIGASVDRNNECYCNYRVKSGPDALQRLKENGRWRLRFCLNDDRWPEYVPSTRGDSFVFPASNHFLGNRSLKVTIVPRDAAADEALIEFVDDLKKLVIKGTRGG